MVFLRDRFRVRDDDDGIVADGERVSVPLALMDSGGDRPGYARPSDDQISTRRSARAAMIRDAEEAWKDARRRKPDPDDPDEDDDDDDDEVNPRDAHASSRAAYDAMCTRLRDAWRTPPTHDFAEPDMSSRPSDLELLRRRPLPHDDPAAAMRSHLSTGPGPAFAEPDAQKRRDAAYENYTSELSNAWKHPRHAAAAPPAILGAGPAHKVVEPGRTDPDAASRIEGLREKTHGGK
jgi:hypothetical protein